MKWIAIVASIQQQQQQHWSEEFVCWFSINLSLSLVLFKAIPPLLGVIYLLFLHLRLLRLFASIPNRALRVVHSLPHFIHSRAVIITRKFHWIISQAMTLNFHWLHLCCCSRTKKVMMMNMRYSSCAFFRVWVVFFSINFIQSTDVFCRYGMLRVSLENYGVSDNNTNQRREKAKLS